MANISIQRLEELASKAIDHIIEMDPDDAIEFLRDELELTKEEAQYFCVFDNLQEVTEMTDEEREEEEEEWFTR